MSKVNEYLTNNKSKIIELLKVGYTFYDIAEKLNVGYSTFQQWKNKNHKDLNDFRNVIIKNNKAQIIMISKKHIIIDSLHNNIPVPDIAEKLNVSAASLYNFINSNNLKVIKNNFEIYKDDIIEDVLNGVKYGEIVIKYDVPYSQLNNILSRNGYHRICYYDVLEKQKDSIIEKVNNGMYITDLIRELKIPKTYVLNFCKKYNIKRKTKVNILDENKTKILTDLKTKKIKSIADEYGITKTHLKDWLKKNK